MHTFIESLIAIARVIVITIALRGFFIAYVFSSKNDISVKSVVRSSTTWRMFVSFFLVDSFLPQLPFLGNPQNYLLEILICFIVGWLVHLYEKMEEIHDELKKEDKEDNKQEETFSLEEIIKKNKQ